MVSLVGYIRIGGLDISIFDLKSPFIVIWGLKRGIPGEWEPSFPIS